MQRWASGLFSPLHFGQSTAGMMTDRRFPVKPFGPDPVGWHRVTGNGPAPGLLGFGPVDAGRWRAGGPLALASALVALAFLPPLRGVTFLGVLRGSPGILLLILGAAASAVRAWPVRTRWPDPSPGRLFAASAVGLVLVGQWYTSRLRVSGDEPHYLLMAQSLWREGDLDLRDNLAREDFREYTPGPVAPHWGTPRRDGRPYPAHSPGLPALLAPFYGLGGRRACAAVLGLAAAALGPQVHALARRLTGEPRAALTAWAAPLGPPMLFYSFLVYTEVPSALAVA